MNKHFPECQSNRCVCLEVGAAYRRAIQDVLKLTNAELTQKQFVVAVLTLMYESREIKGDQQ